MDSSPGPASAPPAGPAHGLTNGRLVGGAVLVAVLLAGAWELLAPVGPAGPVVPVGPVTPLTPAGGLRAGGGTQPVQPPIQPAAAGPSADVLIDAIGGPAEVLANGRVIGTTPYRSKLPVGSQVALELRRPGAATTAVQFEVRPTDNRYDILLQRAP
jgi:hypothetical protein